ncbi:MAG: tRNA (adenosine(37)-N6)-dimethylallyltransferase MiaA [Lentisphaerae bacterium]|nr:tRNA (adenosine(37)-N6)-dimethylallyltransferase MiaA [Lentisphaerota bacterium]
MRPPAFFLVGPTASGKTAVAQHLAERGGYAVLSADSMLVYRGMDIGTAKPTAAERRRVPYAGLDLTTPDRPFSAAAYRRRALGALRAHAAAGRPVIVAGGTGLYVKVLMEGLDAAPGPDAALRAAWENVLREQGVEALQAALRRQRPDLYAALDDPRNPRRLVRALEKAAAGAAGAAAPRGPAPGGGRPAGLRPEPALLKSNIESRITAMYRNGLLDEVARLLERYGGLGRTAAQAIGYAEAAAVLEGRLGRAEAMERTRLRTRRLAKRQMTWFRHQTRVCWIDVEAGMDTAAVARAVRAVWDAEGPSRLYG